MQDALLDILILGLLVLLFGSIYRKRPSLRLRYWIVGWFFILAHFALNLPNPASAFWTNADGALSMAALVLGGICFLLASCKMCSAATPELWLQGALAGSVLAFSALAVDDPTHGFLLAAAFLIVESAILFLAFQCWRPRPRIIKASVLLAIGAAFWAVRDLITGQPIPGMYAVLAQVYLLNAVVYWASFRRRSIGVVTGSLGLVAWAAVFPVAVTVTSLWPHLHVNGELWNLPKYFVEFGMILTLVEGEVIELARQREEYRVLFDGNPHPMWIYDKESLAFLKVNAAALAHYGYSQEEFLSRTLRDIRPPEDIARLEHRIKEVGEATQYSGPWTHLRKDGSTIQVEIASHGINFEGHPARFALVQDITERQQLYERLVHQANHDALTGLPNRLLLKDRMEQLLVAAERQGNRAAILCIDLDRFKQVNDTYGHHVGDVCLQKVAVSLREKLRMTDTIARSGGEEFIVLLGQLRGVADAGMVAQVLVNSFHQALLIEGHTISLAASIGIAMYPMDGTTAQDLWRVADSAMYRAKHAGGNRYIFACSDGFSKSDQDLDAEMSPVLGAMNRSLASD